MESLTEISRSQPHAAFVAFTNGYKSKFTYYLRTIESFEDYVDPTGDLINDSFLPTLFGRAEPLPEELKELATLSPAQGGIGIPDLKREAPEQFKASSDITAIHVDSIVAQSSSMPANEQLEELKRDINTQRRASAKSRRDRIDELLSPDLLHAYGLALNKEEFGDSLCLRYNLPLSNLPSFCACGERFTVSHALSCKKGGFVAQRNDTIRDLLTAHISKVCKNVETEPLLQPLDNEVFNLQSTVTSKEARLDMKAGGFWTPGVTAFCDVRVTHVNSQSNQNKPTETIFREQENEKKRKYNQRIINVEIGTFTPLVFGTNGGMGVDCKNFLKYLAEKLSIKNGEAYASVISWIRIELSFAILRTVHKCKTLLDSAMRWKKRRSIWRMALTLTTLTLTCSLFAFYGSVRLITDTNEDSRPNFPLPWYRHENKHVQSEDGFLEELHESGRVLHGYNDNRETKETQVDGKHALLGCREIRAIRVMEELGHGYTKRVERGILGGTQFAVKSVQHSSKDVQRCLHRNHTTEHECFNLIKLKLAKEILILKQLQQTNIIKVCSVIRA
ncbi:predicted protein [Nematostella vectensis]|uniref:Uncharacterized protein n=1 Tax=Nematostella vectensis TaxID=45351 RepID=A7SNF1_NEMVE|nr:predicted protein [Nematostella vectensis]|eukprot:XP_001626868.1 predicted protein [Nematostella vectensis]